MAIKHGAAPLFSHRVDGDYRSDPRSIKATRGLAKLQRDLEEIVHLADLANTHDKPIAPALGSGPPGGRRLPDAVTPSRRRFLSLMDHPGRLGAVLLDLHEVGVLEKIIPAMDHARCLLQFNEYHKYTVDEHCLRAVKRRRITPISCRGRGVYRGSRRSGSCIWRY